MTTINAQINPSARIIAKSVTLNDVSAESVGLGNVDNTSDADKPISTLTQSALDLKASQTDLNTHTSDTNNPHVVTASQVGLGNADNTPDADKPISIATQIALDLKADKDTTYTRTEVDDALATKPSSSDFGNIVKLTQEEYDDPGFTPDPNTLYIIVV